MSVNDHRNSTTDIDFEVMAGPTPSSATYIFGNEDHTLGNAIRHVLMKRTETEFCGYSVPHPYEPKMNVRLQVSKDTTSQKVLLAGLKDLEECANQLDDVFVAALNNFNSSGASNSMPVEVEEATTGRKSSKKK